MSVSRPEPTPTHAIMTHVQHDALSVAMQISDNDTEPYLTAVSCYCTKVSY